MYEIGATPVTRLHVLLPMAADGRGPSWTCLQLLPGMAESEFAIHLYVNRLRAPVPAGIAYSAAVPQLASRLPYRMVKHLASLRTERQLLDNVSPGDIVFAWPAASLAVHEELARRHVTVVLEGINTRMSSARRVLDNAYAAEGLKAAHGITDRRIREEERKLELADFIFAPSRDVELALGDTEIASRGGVLPTSYGVKRVELEQVPQDTNEPVFTFVGLSSVRKGLHLLLRAWEAAEVRGRLAIYGGLDADIRRLCAPQLRRDDVEYRGYASDVSRAYAASNVFVFPSLEEGGPQVTYEAAAHGLPIIASHPGAGRLGDQPGAVLTVDPFNQEELVAALRTFAASAEQRMAYGARALDAVRDYTWAAVGRRRAAALGAALDSHR